MDKIRNIIPIFENTCNKALEEFKNRIAPVIDAYYEGELDNNSNSSSINESEFIEYKEQQKTLIKSLIQRLHTLENKPQNSPSIAALVNRIDQLEPKQNKQTISKEDIMKSLKHKQND